MIKLKENVEPQVLARHCAMGGGDSDEHTQSLPPWSFQACGCDCRRPSNLYFLLSLLLSSRLKLQSLITHFSFRGPQLHLVQNTTDSLSKPGIPLFPIVTLLRIRLFLKTFQILPRGAELGTPRPVAPTPPHPCRLLSKHTASFWPSVRGGSGAWVSHFESLILYTESQI